MASLLGPLRLAVLELSSERRPTLPLVLPIYLRLEKLFTSKAGETGAGGRLCHYFLEALKENLRVERLHQVAMVLDPQLKLRPTPTHQHDEIIAKVCETAGEMREDDAGGGAGPGEGVPGKKRARLEGGAAWARGPDDPKVRKELFQYLAEPTFHVAPDLFQYWSSATDKFPKLARLALWLLAVPAVGTRSECATVCQQTLTMKRRRQVRPEEANKLIFLKSNMA
ncbi:hypothetical protein AAFF_G00009820 [Aldrovandia affinis]|uniref:HAT C-terminal dimerisation domain-containing protein n=1 Tax=Aldrovandia affinis TaxID=143900 RepID=A0AAD7S7A8_9TELE|nr:hypothetical protein AAFF_G00009820 [Aldrovandia affinis]